MFRSNKIIILLFAVFITAFSDEGMLPEAWNLFRSNKPLQARSLFTNELDSRNHKTVASAFRGLAYVAKFLGLEDSMFIYTFEAFKYDNDTVALNAAWLNVLSFGRNWHGHTYQNGYKILKELTKGYSLFTGEYYSLLAERYINDGNLSSAEKLVSKLGIVRDFRMIGPFENISGSGYNKIFPPEKKIDFANEYFGKDKAYVEWHQFKNKSPNGWVFTEYNFLPANSVNYYYSNIILDDKQSRKVRLSFGASGAFKIFLNDNIVLADSVFRNTGTDMFTQDVMLNPKGNKLLIKVCHESRYSNFIIRITDTLGAYMQDISYSDNITDYQIDTTKYANLTNSPVFEIIETELLRRLADFPKSIEISLLLMDLYNTSEETIKGQMLARDFISYYPNSSLWWGMYAESLLRNRKLTAMQTALKTAYKECSLNFQAWQYELNEVSQNSDSRTTMEFLKKSPKEFRDKPTALLLSFAHFAKNDNESDAIRIIEKFMTKYSHDNTILTILTSFLINSGDIKKAEKILKNHLQYEHTATSIYALLGSLYMKKGDRDKVVKAYIECLKYSPNASGFFYYLAELAMQQNEHDKALSYLDKALLISPSASTIITLRGLLLSEMGEKQRAIDEFKKAIRYTYNDFNAWEYLLSLEGKTEPTTLTQQPDPDSLIAMSHAWNGRKNDRGAVLAYIKDIFFYPSRAIRERYFLMVHLPTQTAIESWKEYRISYNRYYQSVTSIKARSRNINGKETPADINGNVAFFKTLKPGDYIIIEWSIDNNYQHKMAGHVWGTFNFDLPYPVFKSELRFVTPKTDTIPTKIIGDSIQIKNCIKGDFLIRTFSRASYKNPTQETYSVINPLQSHKVIYSTFKDWSEIVSWYSDVTDNKLEQSYEIANIVDSLCKGTKNDREKVERIHKFITNSIRYSYVSFRQSAWIPQPSREVLATKIGDCKDMSSLGKTMLDIAGIKSDLVLVNTRNENGVFVEHIGPNFNHCILAYTINGITDYIDFTDNNLALGYLPYMDQGALALIISKNSDLLIHHLPIDTKDNRTIRRLIRDTLTVDGTLKRTVKSVKSGIFAGNMFSSYRFLSYTEQKKKMHRLLSKKWTNVSLDTLFFSDINTVSDSIGYTYRFEAKKTAQFSGKTVLLTLNIPNALEPAHFPGEENRHYSIDMQRTWFGVGTFRQSGSLVVPNGWRLVDDPEPIIINRDWGKYSLDIEQSGNVITISRYAEFDFNEFISADKSFVLREDLSAIANADNIQLMFYYKK